MCTLSEGGDGRKATEEREGRGLHEVWGWEHPGRNRAG